MATKLIFYIIIIALLAIAAVWFASSPGDVVAVWRDYEITMSTANFVFAVLLLVALLAIVIPLILGLFTAPYRWWKRRQETKYRKGLQLVTETLAAISTGDVAQAENLVKRSKKLLHQQPIVPLLQAQLAGLKKDENLLQQSFQSMLGFQETKALGSKSLAEFHLRKGDVIPAIPHAEQALDLEPKNSQSLKTTLSLYVRSGQYERARELIATGRKRKALSGLEVKELEAMLLTVQSEKAATENHAEQARALILSAYKLMPHHPPIFLKAIDLFNTDQHADQAVKILKRSWKAHYTPALVDLAADLMLPQPAKQKLYKKLIGASDTGRLPLCLMLAELSLREQDELEAYSWLEKYQRWSGDTLDLPMKPNKHAHISVASELRGLIASLKEKQQRARWECQDCGSQATHWQPICGSCQSMNTIALHTG